MCVHVYSFHHFIFIQSFLYISVSWHENLGLVTKHFLAHIIPVLYSYLSLSHWPLLSPSSLSNPKWSPSAFMSHTFHFPLLLFPCISILHHSQSPYFMSYIHMCANTHAHTHPESRCHVDEKEMWHFSLWAYSGFFQLTLWAPIPFLFHCILLFSFIYSRSLLMHLL